MIQLLAKRVLTMGFKKWVYPHMSINNFRLVWGLLISQISNLPFKVLIINGLNLMKDERMVRVLTTNKILNPVLDNVGITKTEIKDNKSEVLVKTVFSIISFSRLFKFILKMLLWLPKLIFSLFIMSLVNIDVSYIFTNLSWLTRGFSDLILIILNTIWNLLKLTWETGEIKNYLINSYIFRTWFSSRWNSFCKII
jgi:hypothetical protein